jgi:hypothetical protein
MSSTVVNLKFSKQVLVSVERLHRHKIGQRIVCIVERWNELRHYGHVVDGLGVCAGEKRVIQNAAGGSFLNAETST